MSEYRLVDESDEDGPDYVVEDEFGEVGRHFNLADAERHLGDLRFVEAVDR